MDCELRNKFFEQLEKESREIIDEKTGLIGDQYSNKIDCPLCGSPMEKQEKLFMKKGYVFVRCTHCGMIFSNPQVKEEYINQIYGRSKAEDVWVELQKSEKEKTWKKEYYLDCIKLLKKYTAKDDIRLLDIGCSTGYFLEILKEQQPGWSVMGLELNDKAHAYAVSKGLNVDKKLLEDIEKNQTFDVITLFGVMEHLTNPKKYLREIARFGNKEPVMVMAIVPNAYSLYHMFLQEKSVSFDGRDHLLYFSTETLKNLFEMIGFEVLHTDTVLTGIEAIKRQIQWYDPYSAEMSARYLSEKMKSYFQDGLIKDFIYKHDLGLRLRILAKYQKK